MTDMAGRDPIEKDEQIKKFPVVYTLSRSLKSHVSCLEKMKQRGSTWESMKWQKCMNTLSCKDDVKVEKEKKLVSSSPMSDLAEWMNRENK